MATAPSSPFQSAMLEVVNKIHAAPTTRDILVGLKPEIQALFGCERLTIFALDTKNQQLYSISETGTALKEIRVPKTFTSIAGFTGLSRKTINVSDAYDDARLKKIHPKLSFDPTWDQKTNFRTKQVLSAPINFEKYLLGVIQLVNRKADGPFSPEEVKGLEEVAKTIGIAFYNQRKATSSAKPTKYGALIAKGAVSENDVQKAAGESRMQNCSIEKVLMDRYNCDKADILQSLSAFYANATWSYTDKESIPEELCKRLNVDFLRKNHWAPVRTEGRVTFVAVEDPHDLAKLDAIEATNLSPKLELLIGIREDIHALIDATFGEETEDEDDDEGDDDFDLDLVSEEEEDDDDGADEQDNQVVKLANRIIRDAYRMGVSDIHIEPYGERHPTVVRFRCDGECSVYKEVSPQYRTALVSRLKIMARLDIAEKRKPQDGKICFRTKKGPLELRVATIPTTGGNEDIVMRILAGSEPLPLDKMGFNERNLREFKAAVIKPYGLVLVVGPTGSGKTTTLHSGLGFINTEGRKIWTAEDPVEITQKGLRQVQVMPKIGVTFAAAMRSFLRADPDVIMVGEMRDRETAQTGIEASLTGHLVFSTLHTNSAAETITRLLDMEIDPFSFSDALLAILAQRLLRTLCKDCKEEYQGTEDEFNDLVKAYGPEHWGRTKIKYGPEFKMWKQVGCPACADSGMRGRMAIHELITTTPPLVEMIAEKAPIAALHEQAIKDGMETLMQDGVVKVCKGQTSMQAVRTVCMK